MAFSGTVDQTLITVQQFIDHGARRAGKLAEELTVEQVQSAQDSLYFLLSNLINQGVQYFAVQKTVVGLIPNQYEYVLPAGANDVLNALYRRMTQPSGSYTSSDGGSPAAVYSGTLNNYFVQSVTNGNIEVNYGSTNSQYIGSIGFVPYVSGFGTQTWNYQFQTSIDNITWQTLYTGTSVVVTDGQWIWQDIDPGATNAYYRMIATSGTTLSLRQLYFGTISTEIVMARLNRDDYTNLPNKNFTANQPFQYWFNRTIPSPTVVIWPTPASAFYQMTIWYSAQVQDVGVLTNQLAVPRRWYLAIVSMLAHQMSMELPGIAVDRIQYLEIQAEKYFNMAEQEERDRSPIYLAPNISVYSS